MLQQTQVPRVLEKFTSWIERFPTIQSVADASLIDVITEWSGLGYNRRAKYIHESAKQITARYNGVIPHDFEYLCTLPGIGKNTAAAILAYAYNQPQVFIETNIRTVYIHHFFHDQPIVTDAEIKNLVQATLDVKNPRQWYWALMDYGTYLKKQSIQSAKKSAMYKKQSSFAGSTRQLRGLVIKNLISGPMTLDELYSKTNNDERLQATVSKLQDESLIIKDDNQYLIA